CRKARSPARSCGAVRYEFPSRCGLRSASGTGACSRTGTGSRVRALDKSC
ncbi:MAG: hypothetical protein AVDCRST_MAG89-2365, partial [uncultured Gemmatimonadetes bacterium]